MKNKISKKSKIITILISSIILLSAIITPILYFSLKNNKDKEYLYNWLVDEGTLVDNSNLEYTTTKDGASYSLCYSTDYIDSLNMMILYSSVTDEGYTISARIHLFTGDETVFYISAENDELNRWYKYSFTSSTYKNNTPLTYIDNDGYTIDISEYMWFDGEKYHVDYNSMPSEMKEKIETLKVLGGLCEDSAKPILNNMLNWLKDEICLLTNMNLSDFGYQKY